MDGVDETPIGASEHRSRCGGAGSRRTAAAGRGSHSPGRPSAHRWDARHRERAHRRSRSPPSPPGFAGPDELATALEGTGYLPDEGLATAAYLALVMHRPLFLEGEAGVGKTALAHALAQVTGRPIYRLQCYEGLEASQALYDWDFGRQLLHLRAAEAAHATDDPELAGGLALRPPVPAGPPAAAGAGGLPQRAARRRGRPGRRRVRGVPARGAVGLHDLHPGARHGARRRPRRSSSSPPTAPARCTTPSSAAASTTGCSTPTSTARWRSCAGGCPR